MKHILFATIIGLGLVSLSGCTDSKDASVSKCQSGKCDSAKKMDKKCGDAKKASKKCGS